MLEKKNGGLILQTHEGEVCGRELDPQCFSGNGPFRGQLHARPIIHKKKKTQRTKSAYEMKEVGSCSPNSEALEDYALLIDVGFIGQKLTSYKPATRGWSSYYRMGVTFFFFLISIVT